MYIFYKIWKYYNSKKISFNLENINNKDKNFDYINNLINESKRKKNKNIKLVLEIKKLLKEPEKHLDKLIKLDDEYEKNSIFIMDTYDFYLDFISNK